MQIHLGPVESKGTDAWDENVSTLAEKAKLGSTPLMDRDSGEEEGGQEENKWISLNSR